MVSKLKTTVIKYKKIIFILIALVFIVIIGLVINNQISKNDKPAKPATAQHNDKYQYRYLANDVSCQMLPTAPNATTTMKVCKGTIKVDDPNSKSSVSYDVRGSSHLYRNGTEIPIEQLSSLTSGSTMVSLTFYQGSKIVNNIAYIAD